MYMGQVIGSKKRRCVLELGGVVWVSVNLWHLRCQSQAALAAAACGAVNRRPAV